MNTYQEYLKESDEYGLVTEIHYPIVKLSGLPNVGLNELVMFESGQLAQVISLDKNSVEALLFSNKYVSYKEQATRTKQQLLVPADETLLGCVINPLGESLYQDKKTSNIKNRVPIFTNPIKIAGRTKIKDQLITGTTIVDLLIPLGKGQRELVVGDRKTGKTAFLLTTVKSQVKEGSVVVYAAIGKTRREIKRIKSFLDDHKIASNVIVVATSPDQSPGLIFLTPYTAVAIAEYFRDQGKNTLVILDDLSTHAKFHREISLLGKKFPGRESYPGDIFHIHAKILERAGNFKTSKGDTSITAIPVAETSEADLTGYIVSNLISITDGHLLFDETIFASGRKPAIDIFLSVTRVGRQTKKSYLRGLSTEIFAAMTQHQKWQNLSQFGSELSEEVRNNMKKIDQLYGLLLQSPEAVIPVPVQLVMIMIVWLNLVPEETAQNLQKLRDKLTIGYETKKDIASLIDKTLEAETIDQVYQNIKNSKDKIIAYAK